MLNDENVPAEKLVLAVPFFTRLWMITADETGAETVTSDALTMDEQAATIAEHGATATYDESTGQDYATFTEDGVTYKIWLENATSMEARMQLIKNYSLAGCASWSVGLESEDIWGVLNSYLN